MPLSIFGPHTSRELSHRKELIKENDDLQRTICSDGLVGKYSQTSDVNLFLNNEMQILQTESQQEANKFISIRARFMQSQIEELKDINLKAQKILSESQSLSGAGIKAVFNLQDFAKNTLDQVTQILNRRLFVGGEVTLAGTSSQNNAVVDLNTLPSLSAGAGADFSYYKGGACDQQVTVDGKDTVDILPVTASEPGIETLIRALRLTKQVNNCDYNDPFLKSALSLTAQASTSLSIPAEKIAFTQKKVESVNLRLEHRKEELTDGIKASLSEDGAGAFMESLRIQENLNISRHLDVQRISNIHHFLQQLERLQ